MDVSLPFLPRIINASCPHRAHLVGIAGNGMRALADVLLGWGWFLSGSDLDVGPVQSLVAAGVRLFAGHAAEHVSSETELVVFSDAVPAADPEIRRAAELGIPRLSYFQMLGRLGVGRRTVAVAGTHGKSTTAAMLAHLLVRAGCDPTVVYGATPLGATSGGRAGRSISGQWSVVSGQCEPHISNPQSLISNPSGTCPHPNPLPKGEGTAGAGGGRIMLVEACEYRANFLHLRPQQAAILGIEPDHFDCYDSLVQLEDAFRRFASSIPKDGLLVARHDCESTGRATAGLDCRVESFGLSADADWSARRIAENRGRF
jgi:UDP-N-acetylmuramate--alanine ligase